MHCPRTLSKSVQRDFIRRNCRATFGILAIMSSEAQQAACLKASLRMGPYREGG